jgi:hypothetical protein
MQNDIGASVLDEVDIFKANVKEKAEEVEVL